MLIFTAVIRAALLDRRKYEMVLLQIECGWSSVFCSYLRVDLIDEKRWAQMPMRNKKSTAYILPGNINRKENKSAKKIE